MEQTTHKTALDARLLLKEAKVGYLSDAADEFLLHLEAGLLTWAARCREELNIRIAVPVISTDQSARVEGSNSSES